MTNWNTRWGWKEVTAHPDFFAGALAKAQELGFNLEHFWLREPGLTHGRLNRILYARGINGVIIASHMREIDMELQFDWKHLSGVKIDYFPHKPELHNVTNNQCDVIRLAMQKLIAAGYRRIGFVMHRDWDHSVDHLWTAGYLCEQQNLAPKERIPAHIFPGPLPVERWFKESKADVTTDPVPFERWYEKHRPEVIVSKASFVLPQIKRMGLRIPRDVAFVDVFLDEFSGKTAGVRQNHATVGALAVEILAGQYSTTNSACRRFPPRHLSKARGSTAPRVRCLCVNAGCRSLRAAGADYGTFVTTTFQPVVVPSGAAR